MSTKHKHDHCEHSVKWCGDCNTCYCTNCAQEWPLPCTQLHSLWPWPQTWTNPAPFYGTRDNTGDTFTITSQTCTHQ